MTACFLVLFRICLICLTSFTYRKKSFVTHNFELLIESCSKGFGVTQLSFTSDVPCETEIIMFEFDVNVKITMKASKSIFTLELELYTMPLVCNFKLLIRNYSFDNTSFEQSLISGSWGKRTFRGVSSNKITFILYKRELCMVLAYEMLTLKSRLWSYILLTSKKITYPHTFHLVPCVRWLQMRCSDKVLIKPLGVS